MADENDIDPTAWRWLRETYVRLLATGAGVDHRLMTEEQRELLIEPHLRAMEADLATIMMLVGRGQNTAIEEWRERIHKVEGADHDMLDEALDFAASPTEGQDG